MAEGETDKAAQGLKHSVAAMKIGLKTDGYKGRLFRGVIEKAYDLVPAEDADIIFAVGWTRMIKEDLEKHVVMHDSLLPRYRGFCPTVTALIKGDTEIGVTALRPIEKMDEGPVLWQQKVNIEYPIKIKDAYDWQLSCYLRCFEAILEKRVFALNPPEEPTYSIWRDEEDYHIDWTEPSHYLKRFIDAVGYPYEGAFSYLGVEKVRIFDAEVVDDVIFMNRTPGKIWCRHGEMADVVCGKGILRVKLGKGCLRARLS